MIIGKFYKVTLANVKGEKEKNIKLWGKCVWIHPKRRFCILRFDDGLKECFQPFDLGVY